MEITSTFLYSPEFVASSTAESMWLLALTATEYGGGATLPGVEILCCTTTGSSHARESCTNVHSLEHCTIIMKSTTHSPRQRMHCILCLLAEINCLNSQMRDPSQTLNSLVPSRSRFCVQLVQNLSVSGFQSLHWTAQCFTSPPTQYRLYRRQFYRSKDPTNSIEY